MPLVAPVLGVGKRPWVLEFVKVAKLMLRNLPLFPAPTADGQWTNSVTSQKVATQCLKPVVRQRPRNNNNSLPEEHGP